MKINDEVIAEEFNVPIYILNNISDACKNGWQIFINTFMRGGGDDK